MSAETAIEKSGPYEIDVRRSNDDGHAPGSRRSMWTYRPSVDIFETGDEYLLVADMPGTQAESIDVSVERGLLTIEAEIGPRVPSSDRWYAQEYGVGTFHRRFAIDEAIVQDELSAEYRNGVLTVHLPKGAQARRRRIAVSA